MVQQSNFRWKFLFLSQNKTILLELFLNSNAHFEIITQ